MSYRIWQAWKVSTEKVNEALNYLENRMVNEYIYPNYKKLIEKTLSKLTKEDIEKYGSEFTAAEQLTYKKLKEGSLSLYRCNYNLDCNIGVIINKDYCYLIPYGYQINSNSLPDYLVDYHCQTQTDNELTEEELDKRINRWNDLLKLNQCIYHIFEGTGMQHYKYSDKYYKEEYKKNAN